MNLDFLAIGDTVVDDFIRLKDASVHCDINTENCTISLRWGDKVPFESSTVVYGVGNAANAAVSAARLGLSSGLLSDIGADDRGEKILAKFKNEGLDVSHITSHADVPTNYHYVLWYENERTILVKQNPYPYRFPKDLLEPKGIYFSSIGQDAEQYREDIMAYLEAHPAVFFTFQPGIFEIKQGADRFKRFYQRANLCVCNKEEAERILELPAEMDAKALIRGMHMLGPKNIVITDGIKGAYASDGTKALFVPVHPDGAHPFERTGAGDAFTSTVMSALIMGKPLEEALLWGPVNAASVVQKIGAQEGLLTREALLAQLASAPADYKVSPL
jgi:ribokinase